MTKKLPVKQVFFKKLDTLQAGHTYVLSGWQLYDAMYDATRTKSTVKYTGKDQKYWFIPSGVRIGGG